MKYYLLTNYISYFESQVQKFKKIPSKEIADKVITMPYYVYSQKIQNFIDEFTENYSNIVEMEGTTQSYVAEKLHTLDDIDILSLLANAIRHISYDGQFASKIQDGTILKLLKRLKELDLEQRCIPTPMDKMQLLFDENTIRKAEQYYEMGQVIDITKDKSIYTSLVHGTKEYQVEIVIQQDTILDMSCNCKQYQINDCYCKHMYATLLGITNKEYHLQSSIYEYILENIQADNTLRQGFSIHHEFHDFDLVLEDGALDSFVMDKAKLTNNKALLTQVTKMVCRLCDKTDSKEIVALEELLQDELCVRFAFDFIKLIKNNEVTIQYTPLLQLAIHLVAYSRTIEAVKFGLVLFSLFQIDHDEKLKEMVYHIALCEEFTMFAIIAIADSKQSQEMLWHLATKLKGWGKIQVIKQLKVDTLKQKKWILTQGYITKVIDSSHAIHCLIRGDALALLKQEELELDVLLGINEIVLQLFLTDKMKWTKLYSHTDQLLALLLNQIAKQCYTLSFLVTVIDIERYLKKKKVEHTDKNRKKMTSMVQELIDRPYWIQLVYHDIASMYLPYMVQATIVAKRLHIKVYDQIWDIVDTDPMLYYPLIDYLFTEQSYVKKLVETYERRLPLDKMKAECYQLTLDYAYENESKILEKIVEQLKGHPLLGEKLIIAAIQNPYQDVCMAAIVTISYWQASLELPIEEISKAIVDTIEERLESETDEELQELLAQLTPPK